MKKKDGKIRKIKFVVPGNPVGYIATTYNGKWGKEYLKFANYAKTVRLFAKAAGIRVPLLADRQKPIVIRTVAYFKNGSHCDPGNVQKGVVDALFYDENHDRGKKTRKGDDKWTGGSFPPPRYDKKNPRVVVTIKDYVRKEK